MGLVSWYGHRHRWRLLVQQDSGQCWLVGLLLQKIVLMLVKSSVKGV